MRRGLACSIREIHEAFPEKNRPAYTAIQTTVYRMEGNKALPMVGVSGVAGSKS
jgi:BlaI family penicillinase repressor